MRTTDEMAVATDLNETPQENWSLEQLGEYCRRTHRMMAVYAWRIGRALNFAKAQLEHGRWMAWLKTYCSQYSPSTIHRYMRLARHFREEELDAVTLTVAYHTLGIHNRAKPKGETGLAQKRVVKLSSPMPNDSPAVSESEALDTESSHLIVTDAVETDDEPDPEAELIQDLEGFLVDQIELLASTVVSILEHDDELRLTCWGKVEVKAIAQQIELLQRRLGELLADMALQDANGT